MVAGIIPFDDKKPIQAAFAVVNKKLRPVIPKGCPPPLRDLIEHSWTSASEKRPEFWQIVYTHLDHLVVDMCTSNGYMKVDSYIHAAFLQAWLWEHFERYAPKPLALLPESWGGSRILRWSNRRPKIGSKLIGFLDNSHAINFRPWAPMHASITQINTFAPVPSMSLSSDKEDTSVGEMVFM